ncbi:hypothetical protein [Nonomuraea rubra]|uniref:hypothetical protein n=1 Tax=Nonomuraea rubra TaxID=46180 RepID=UPI0033F1AA95
METPPSRDMPVGLRLLTAFVPPGAGNQPLRWQILASLTAFVFTVALLLWGAGLLNWVDPGIQAVSGWTALTSVALRVVLQMPLAIRRSRDLGDRVSDLITLSYGEERPEETAAPPGKPQTGDLDDLGRQILERQRALHDLERKVNALKDAVDAVPAQGAGVDLDKIMQAFNDYRRSSERSQRASLILGIILSIPIGIAINLLTP